MTRRGLAAGGVLLGLLAGCSDDESGPLSEDQLPGEVVESGSSTGGTPTATLCPAITQVQRDIAASGGSARDSFRYWTYRLDDGTWISVSVVDSARDPAAWGETVTAVEAAVDSCTTRANVGEIAPLGGLPEGVVGFSATRTDSNGTRLGETVIAGSGDHILMVTTTHDEGTEPSVDVRDLLVDVQGNVGELDLSSARA